MAYGFNLCDNVADRYSIVVVMMGLFRALLVNAVFRVWRYLCDKKGVRRQMDRSY